MTPATSSSLVPTSTSNESHTRVDELHARSRFATDGRDQQRTVLSEHHNKEQKKRTQRRSATMFAVFLLCVLRDTLCLTPAMGCAHAWMSGRAYESSLSMSRLVYRLKTSAALWQCGWSGTNKKRGKKKKKKMMKKIDYVSNDVERFLEPFMRSVRISG